MTPPNPPEQTPLEVVPQPQAAGPPRKVTVRWYGMLDVTKKGYLAFQIPVVGVAFILMIVLAVALGGKEGFAGWVWLLALLAFIAEGVELFIMLVKFQQKEREQGGRAP